VLRQLACVFIFGNSFFTKRAVERSEIVFAPFKRWRQACCGSAWIRINLTRRIRIRIRIKVISWIRIRISLQMTSQNVRNMSLFEHFFKVLSFYSQARIRIRIRFQSNKQNSDPHQCDAYPQQFKPADEPPEGFFNIKIKFICV
jgi:hypothetical protein